MPSGFGKWEGKECLAHKCSSCLYTELGPCADYDPGGKGKDSPGKDPSIGK